MNCSVRWPSCRRLWGLHNYLAGQEIWRNRIHNDIWMRACCPSLIHSSSAVKDCSFVPRIVSVLEANILVQSE